MICSSKCKPFPVCLPLAASLQMEQAIRYSRKGSLGVHATCEYALAAQEQAQHTYCAAKKRTGTTHLHHVTAGGQNWDTGLQMLVDT